MPYGVYLVSNRLSNETTNNNCDNEVSSGVYNCCLKSNNTYLQTGNMLTLALCQLSTPKISITFAAKTEP